MFHGDGKHTEYGLTLLRVVTGLILLQAGYNKVFVSGFDATIMGFQGMGMFAPKLTAPLVAVLELVGGGALVLGIWPRYLGGLFAIQFLVAIYAKVVLMKIGWSAARIDILLVVIGILLLTNGGGAFSLGRLLRKGA